MQVLKNSMASCAIRFQSYGACETSVTREGTEGTDLWVVDSRKDGIMILCHKSDEKVHYNRDRFD